VVVDGTAVVGGEAFSDGGVGGVQAAEESPTKGAALGGVGIDVVEMGEVRRILGRVII